MKKPRNADQYLFLVSALIICIIGLFIGFPKFIEYLNYSELLNETSVEIMLCFSVVFILLLLIWIWILHNWIYYINWGFHVSTWILTILFVITFLLGIYAIIDFLLGLI